MNKQELKNGFVVEIRSGEIYLVFDNLLNRRKDYIDLDNYEDNLRHKLDPFCDFRDLDIVKVGNYLGKMMIFDLDLCNPNLIEWIWERQNYNIVEIDLGELTYFEEELAKYLIRSGFQYLVRNKADRLMAYTLLPEYNKTGWITQKSTDMKLVSKYLFKDLFTFLTYEGKEIYNLYNVIGVK